NNHVIRETAPGRSLSKLTGVRVEDFGRLAAPGAKGLFNTMSRSGGLVIPPDRPAESSRRIRRFTVGNHFYENLAVEPDVEIVGVWSNRYAAGTPAITSRAVGKGRVLYVGTYLTPELTAQLATRTFVDANVEPLVPDLPDGVEVTMRQNDERRLLFVQNIKDTPVAVTGVPSGSNLLDSELPVSGVLTLDGYGCAVIE
ncbi:MAG: beta-galactosidase, partial [Mesorhizobium sp.]